VQEKGAREVNAGDVTVVRHCSFQGEKMQLVHVVYLELGDSCFLSWSEISEVFEFCVHEERYR
jgi:hypothetical protein